MLNMIALSNNLRKIRLFLFIFQFLLSIHFAFCGNCKNIYDLTNSACFNAPIIFNDSNWRAGHAATNKNNVTIVEFSLDNEDSKSRIFYGLKQNGRYYFKDGFKKIDTMSCDGCSTNYRGRFESRNLFVSLYNNSAKQYLFSMSSYKSLTELINIDAGDNFDYHAWDTLTFFGLSRPIFSLEFSLIEIGDTNYYIAAFIESAGEKPDSEGKLKEFSNTTTILKFKLTNYASSNYRVITNNQTISNTYNGRCVSAFRFDQKDRIVLLFVEPTGEKTGKYIARFYDDSLTEKGDHSIYDTVQGLWVGFGIFVKGISIRNNYAALAFYHNGGSDTSLVFKFVGYKDDTNFNYKHDYNFDSYHFNQDVDANGLYKLDDDRVALLATEVIYKDGQTEKYTKLHMFLFDFYNNFEGYKIREYIFSYPNRRFAKELATYMYNGYILLCATLSDSGISFTFADMLIFGFGNGTDHIIDISPYLMDTGYYSSSNNLFTYLMSKMTIDNNIFDYQKVQKIRLVAICDELKLYRGTLGVNKEDNTLPLNELFDADHTLLQNKDLTKEEDKLYTLEYQYLVKEPDYNTLYNSAHDVKTVLSSLSNDDNVKNNYYKPKTLNGRTNILSFKLCHRYCIKCTEFGTSDNDQRCVNCKEEYTYDYLAAVNKFTGNCVPEGKMYDAESKVLKNCDQISDYKYYFNVTRSNKKYCFKYMYECPKEYHYLVEERHECIDYTPPPPTTVAPTEKPTTIVTEKPTTIVTEKPTTIVTEKPTTIVTEKPTTIVTEKPTTIVTEKPTTIVTEKPTTIVTEKPTTIVTEKPTTIVTEKPTTIVAEKPTTIITEKPTTIVTEKPTTIITEKPTTIVTEKQTTIITQKPTEKHTTIITEKLIESTIIENKCSNWNLSEATNLTNQDLYECIREELLSRTPEQGVIYKGKEGYNFQVSTAQREIDSLNNNTDMAVIDLGDCEEKLKKANGIEGNLSLIIYKFYKDTDIASEKEVQFEVYNPYNFQKLNLSVCDSVNLYIPVDLSQDPNIYQNIVDQGYDPFDINDKFYREICTQYDSENGTDVLLDAREEYYYSPIVNETSCQGNCHYEAYSLDTKYLICECEVNNDGIVTLDVKHFNEKNVAYSFYSSLKLSNYKVVICYNLVFNFKVFCHNYGSIISAVFLAGYVVSMIYYALRTITPLKVEISRFIFEVDEVENNPNPMSTNKITPQRRASKKKTTQRKLNNNDDDKSFPPKRANTNSKKNSRNKKSLKDTSNSESTNLKEAKSKTIRIAKKKNSNVIISNKYTSKIMVKKQDKSGISLVSKTNKYDIKEKNGKKDKKEDQKNEEEILDPDLMDNYEFNNLEYEQACEYDRRSCCRTYVSVLMREELVLFTFFSCHDYNLFYVKIARFLMLACTSMAFNALFFFHKTMYKKQDIEENWSFWQKLPQLLFVLVSNHLIEVYLCYLSMTDSVIYQIKALSKKPNNGKDVINLIDCMKTKLIVFFISTFILFLGFWYFISAFCAVYQNTQKIFIRDSALSFATSLLDPLVIFGLTMILRSISLSMCCRKKAGCLFKLSDIVPIF